MKKHLDFIKQKWKALHSEPGVFKYNLNVQSRKYLPGKYNFFVEFNHERTTLRRVPQIIPSLFSQFDPNKFNFTKINPKENIIDIPFNDSVISFIINQSPLTVYHSLICPDLEKCHPQLMTETALKFCIQFLLSIDDKGFRIGYNSPGALASVNHLHLHLMFLDFDLYIDNGELEPIGESGAQRLTKRMPTEAICYLVDESNKDTMVRKIFALVEFMCQNNVPHNIFITPDRNQEGRALKVFVYARDQHFTIKDVTVMNVAFCEFSGYIPVGDVDLFNNLTEERVLGKLKEEHGNVYTLLYKYLTDL